MRLKSNNNEAIHVALLSGHAIRIPPEGREVPEMFCREAFAAGAIPASASIDDFSSSEEAEIDDSQLALLVAGVKKMLADNADDFTGAGLPNRKVLSGIVGWNVSVQELSVAWSKVQEEA